MVYILGNISDSSRHAELNNKSHKVGLCLWNVACSDLCNTCTAWRGPRGMFTFP